ncbi:MAG TPA: hypothetical protein VFW19_07790 [Allosphingosinicella sp.]|nr:hypothetical protein [Allosphingosinicella sp.]
MRPRLAARFVFPAAVLNAALLPLSPGIAAAPGPSVAAGIPAPKGWRRGRPPGPIPGAGTYTVALPPELETVPVEGVDSYVSEYRSNALRLVFDFGAHGSPDKATCRRHPSSCSIGTMIVDRAPIGRVAYRSEDPDGGLPYRITYTVRFRTRSGSPDSRIGLTIRAECATARARALADRIVRTIHILPDR